MVLSSVQVRMDSSDWPQSVMHNRGLKPTMMEQGLKPPPDQALKCPRCDSSNTKFCYYNNYSLSQPRHFCKTCKRYWTKGGTLRNVPVGGGCRKNKRAKRTIDQAAAAAAAAAGGASHHHGPINEASTSAAAPGNELNSCPPLGNTHGQLIPGVSSSNMYYALPGNGLAFAAARLGDQRALSHCNTNINSSTTTTTTNNNNGSEFLRISCGAQAASFDIPHGGLSSLSALSALNMARLSSLKPNFSCLSFCGADHGNHGVGSDLSSFFESYPAQIPEASAVLNAHNSEGLPAPFGLSLDNNSNSDIPWRSQQQKLPNIALKAEGQPGDHDHALVPFQDHNNINIDVNSAGNTQKIATSIMPSYSIKVEEEGRLGSEWQVPSDQALFEAAGDSTSLYWNAGAWPDLATYGSSVSPLI